MINISSGYKISIMLTEKCNLKCSHCYMSANPLGKTLSKDQIYKLINKLPDHPLRISITGGEPYMCYDKLYYMLNCIKNKFTNQSNLDIRVETNATFFYNSDNSIKEELEKLTSYGVTTLRVSDDKFHVDGGLDLKKLQQIKKCIKKYNIPIQYSCLYQDKVVNFGRASRLKATDLENKNCLNRPESLIIPYFYTTIDGDVSTCAWKCSPVLGNIFEDSFENILKKLNTPIQLAILKSDIKQVINLVADKNENLKKKLNCILEKQGQCMTCKAMFKGKYNEKTL